MPKTNDTSPDSPNFTENRARNKPRFTLKGGERGGSGSEVLLSGLIEPKVEQTFFGDRTRDFEVFLPKRQIGGKSVEGRKIKGWMEVPTVLDWSSTYRHSEWFKNFKKLAEMFENQTLNEMFITEDLSKKDKQYNHALNVFINSFLTLESKWHSSIPDVEDLIPLLSQHQIVENHAEKIYLNDEYEDREDVKFEEVIVDGTVKKIKYDSFRISTYEQAVEIWFNYLRRMDKTKVHQLNFQGGNALTLDPNHRWAKEYAKKMLAKFKDLEESRFSNMWATMLTLTTYQDSEDTEPLTPEDWDKNRGASWFEAMERLKDSLNKVLNLLRKIASRELETTFHYVWVVEAHESGYPHIHIAIFGDVSEWLDDYTNMLRIKDILENKHDLGKDGVATDFETKPPNGDGTINDLSNYLMKYFKKNFGEIKSKYESESLDDKEWGALVYNACMWLSGYRTWGTSKEVGSVMKTNRNESDKEFENLGGELTEETDRTFEELIELKGDRMLRKRKQKREEYKKETSMN
jgi:hypothetical protein